MARRQGSHAGITGPKVREAALRLFARDGYAAVSMRRIAAEVGVQAGALYLYTGSKQALLAEIMTAHMEHLLDAAGALPARGDPAARLDAFARFHVLYHLGRPDEVFLSYMELRSLEPENFAALEQLRRRYEAIPEAIVRDGIAAGAFGARDARLTAMAIIAMLTGATTWYRVGGRLSPDEIAARYAEMAVGAAGTLAPAMPAQ
ncbi:MAG: TetR/AcrR family transcriptional regulator [Hasllibacter sp.]